jgi:succinate-acetate transporter protein
MVEIQLLLVETITTSWLTLSLQRPTMIFFGGALQILGAIGEWILGNTFPMCLFFTYGTFWIVAGTQLVPAFGVGVQYSTTGNNLHGMTEPAYFATVGMFLSISIRCTPWSLYPMMMYLGFVVC